MKSRCLVAAVVLVVAVNVLVLAGAAWNRSGTPDATVVLTERELAAMPRGTEDSGIHLRLIWRQEEHPWFDAARLAAIGFDTSVPPSSGEADGFYRKALPRSTFVVLELEGEAWRRWLKGERRSLAELERKAAEGRADEKRLQEAQKSLQRQEVGASRLFAVDAGNDADELRRRYPDGSRYLIVPARVRLVLGAFREEGVSLRGVIDALLVEVMTVPRATVAPVIGFLEQGERGGKELYVSPYGPYGTDRPPRYRALVAFGRRHEPWVVSLAPLQGQRDAPPLTDGGTP
jgi:hypothetical protein